MVMNKFLISGVLILNHKGAEGVNTYIYIYIYIYIYTHNTKLLENCYYKIVV